MAKKKKFRVHDSVRFHHVLSDEECKQVEDGTWSPRSIGACEDVFWTKLMQFFEDQGYKFIPIKESMDDHDGPCWSFAQDRDVHDEGPNFDYQW